MQGLGVPTPGAVKNPLSLPQKTRELINDSPKGKRLQQSG